jgi:DNA processing protein
MAEGLFSLPTPFTPPTTEDDRSSWLRLIRSRRVGAVTFHRLVAEHGSVGAALAALPGIARAAGVENYAPCPVEVVRQELAAARRIGARMLCHGEADYPAVLNDLPDAPPVLWVRGDPALVNRPMVALVGARNASSLGLRMARRLAESLGEAGYVTVSGLARGIDAEAHAAALSTGTVAVMAGGIDVTYPDENAGLAAQIAEQGCLVSEQPIGTEPQARHFPLRNRIVSGLARAVVVVEAAARSGSLITARTALDQGREVLAVPGHPFDARAAGCNMLIRDGATLVRSAEDVIEAIGGAAPVSGTPAFRRTDPPGPASEPRSLAETAGLHGLILDRLGPSPLAEDQLIRDLALPAARVMPELLSLELDGRILRQAGGLISRAG